MAQFLVERAIEPQSREEFADFEVALNRLAAEGGEGFDIWSDHEARQTVIRGVDEQQLDGVVDRLHRKFGIAVNVGVPHAYYREILSRRVEIDYTHKKQLGAAGQFARIKLVFEPGEPGSGYCFINESTADALPKEFARGVERSLERSCKHGVLAGFPIIDCTIRLADGAYHDVDSSVVAFEMAARGAYLEGLVKAQCELVEPIMKVDITVPNDSVAAVVNDLKSKRAFELTVEPCRVDALVPLANMFSYSKILDALTGNRSVFAMVFDRFAPVPPVPDPGPFRPAMGMRA